jgi:hypothetical protein
MLKEVLASHTNSERSRLLHPFAEKRGILYDKDTEKRGQK